MGRYGASMLIAGAICLVAAVGAAAQVEVSAVSGSRTASPGDFVTTVFEIINRGGSTETFDLELDLPSGLSPLAPPRSVTLGSGESERLFISISVTRQAEAGEVDVTLIAVARSDESIRDSATIVVDVESSPSLTVVPPRDRQVLPGESVTFTFEVVNRGNVLDRAVLAVRSLRNLAIEIAPPSAELLPGDAALVDVRVTVPEDAEPGRDRITLTARSARFETEASATVDLTILPPSPRDVSRDLSLRVPSVLRVRETTTSDDPFDVRTSISGNAFFEEASELSYSVEIAEFSNLRTVRARLLRPTYGITLGDLTASLSNLIRVEGRGARATFRTGLDTESGATVAGARDLDTDDVHIGARTALQAGGWLAALAGRRQAENEATVVGVSLVKLPVVSPELMVEGALSRDPANVDSAFWVLGNTSLSPFTFDGRFRRAGPHFPGSITDELSVAIEPGVEFADAEISTFFAWERDGLDPSPTQSGTAKTRIGANARLAIDPLPIVISQADYETERSLGTPTLVNQSEFAIEARTSKTFGPLTLGANVLREVTDDRFTGTTIARSQWRAEAELRLPSALIATRLGMTTDVDLDMNTIDERFMTALLSASWQFDAFDVGFSIERNRGETRFAADVDGNVDRWTLSTDGAITLDDDDPARFNLSVAAALDFDLPVSFIKVNGQVEGHVFVDANGNGVRDSGEDGVPNLSLLMDGVQARTDEDGFYRFPPVEPGDYNLAIESLPPTLQSQTSLPRQVSLQAGQRLGINLPLERVSSLRATVFSDADEDGVQDDDESGLSGVRIIAVGPDGQDRRRRTGSDGVAEIGGLTPGRWRVSIDVETLPERFQLTADGRVAVEIDPGERVDVAFGAVEREPEIQFSPTADFSINPTEPRVGETVTLDASASFDPDGSIDAYEWDLNGDGTIDATGPRIEHVYDRAGTFEVTLTVTDDDGLTGSLSKTLEVESR